ncbi:helix-turn-helix transcriptional regulator [Plantactinospora sp. KLBMP9567]|uniref:helix-turn-helix transcriptional regulator n=1 Tax=Plantactinospora sp. KLBMP9567 TaxID=3085900 RepID=UPI0029812E73|nr:helix-turn-helix transcriptional regulator [Plantactinospora sp. KLBMP9567]MDW5325077.1 helix-turn-helix transcriptional regulator [Plantactinospora sp. KLBMP9567]MDW5329278.1 helix-turn-helix transcriptional regulator [Plantactinospora sp. KLBMP9567]
MATRQFQRELRRWRTRKGLTQRALADRVRFSRETVAAVEAGRRYGSQELAVRCDDVLGTGGLLTALWPQVAVEQIAADGRRGPRGAAAGRVDPTGADPESTVESTVGERQSVVDAIDELRGLIDQMLRVHFPAESDRRPEEVHRLTEEAHRLAAQVHRLHDDDAGDPDDPRSAEESRQPVAESRRPPGEARRPFAESHRRGRVGALRRRH